MPFLISLNGLSDFGRKLDFGLWCLGREFRKIASFFFRLGLVILFFWYLIESVCTLRPNHGGMALALGLGSLAVFCTFLAILVKRYREFAQAKDEDKNQPDSVIPFLMLNLPFVVAVEFVTLWRGYEFTGGLLRFTQSVLQRIGHFLF
jgi:hypothetical protein